MTRHARALSVLRMAVYLAGLAAFYLKYVPLVAPFQAVLVPILLLTAFVTWKDLRRGTLVFVFAFPLINSLPYFFGIHEPFPHAPTALVLFLAFFLGVLLHRDAAGEAAGLDRDLVRPMAFWAGLIVVSAAITFFRYANFFPLHVGTIYEIKTNTYGVSAGGAIMSVIFNALNYLTGLAFFWVLSKTLRSEEDGDRVLTALGSGTLLALGFAVVQLLGHPTLGNNPASYMTGLINGTFKDALSFGAYLSMIAPLFLGLFFAAKDRRRKLFALAIVALAAVLVLATGSKIGLASLLLSMAGLAVWWYVARIRARNSVGTRGRRRTVRVAAGILVIAALVAGAAGFGKPVLARLSGLKIVERLLNTRKMIRWRIEVQWDPGVKMLGDYPLTGVGMGGFIIECANYTTFYKTWESIPESAENYLLQVGTEMGIVGLMAALWMGCALFRSLRSRFKGRAAPGDRPNVWLARGAAFGLLAFTLDAQMHSFIGSYEIKYTGWLLVGLLFALSRAPEAKGGAAAEAGGPARGAAPSAEIRSLRRSRTLVLVMVLVAFGAVQLWNATHSLSPRARTEKLGLVQDFGFYPAEKSPDGRTFRWTREYGAIPIESGAEGLSVAIQAAHPDIGRKPVKVRFYYVEGLFRARRLLKEVVLADNGWQNVDLAFGERARGAVLLLLEVDRTWNPKKTLGAADARNLGVAVAATGGL